MITLARSDNSLISRWWWTVDRWLLVTVLLLIGSGILLTLAASPAVAERLGLESFHFAKRQLVYMVAGLGLLVGVSLLSGQGVKRLAVGLFLAGLAGVLATLFYGPEIKGATRWLHVAGFSIQPSEFLKPAFIVVSAWMLAEEFRNPGFPGRLISLGLFLVVAVGLVMQPDFGQTLLIGAIWAGQMVMAGMPLAWLAGLAATGMAALTSAYLLVPHVARRIDTFLDPASGDTYQIDTALNAIRAGGLIGRGPGEGSIKKVLPDAHSDFIYAVAGEEFGAMACLGILALFAVVVLRGLSQLLEEEDAFVVFAAGGLLALFGLQALINISVNLAVIPAKGMTLPFISYGGSSMLALAITMGMVLALTRRSNARLSGRRLRR
jgi:cell division protein FtsW